MAESKSLKRYLLKKVLYRIDFQLITEKMQEEMLLLSGKSMDNILLISIRKWRMQLELRLILIKLNIQDLIKKLSQFTSFHSNIQRDVMEEY